MIIVGSTALGYYGVHTGRKSHDVDFIARTKDVINHIATLGPRVKKVQYTPDATHVYAFLKDSHVQVHEFELAWETNTGSELIEIIDANPDLYKEVYLGDQLYKAVSPEVVLTLKLSHRYKKDSRHFAKTMHDIRLLRSKGYEVPEQLTGWLKRREAETYTYNHPKLQGVTKGDFFSDDGIKYVYDHDSIHEAVKHLPTPAYKYYQPAGEQVGTSKEMFFNQPKVVQLLGVLEESYVLSLERSIIPFDLRYETNSHFKAFMIALEKVCTSITSGWFREFAWENFETVVSMYDKEYVERFFRAVHEGRVAEYTKQ